MIKEFTKTPYKCDSGIILKGMLEQVKLLYAKDPVAAGELAISFMEEILLGDHSSDDFMVEFALANFKIVIEDNRHRREVQEAAAQDRDLEMLRPLAELWKKGWTQMQLAKHFNTTQGNISKRLAKIRTHYSWLLDKDEEYSGNNLEYSEQRNNILTEEYVANIPDIPKEEQKEQMEFIPNITNIPVFQKFLDVNGNDNVNVNDNVEENLSPRGESGLRPDTPAASPKVRKFEGKFEF